MTVFSRFYQFDSSSVLLKTSYLNDVFSMR